MEGGGEGGGLGEWREEGERQGGGTGRCEREYFPHPAPCPLHPLLSISLLPPPPPFLRYKTACKADAVFTGSAMNLQGVQAVKDWVVTKLPEGPTLYPKVRGGGGRVNERVRDGRGGGDGGYYLC